MTTSTTPDMADTREDEAATAKHGFGASDADQLTAARLEIDELRREVARLMTELDGERFRLNKARAESVNANERACSLATALGIINRTVAGVTDLTGEDIPF